MNQNKFYNVLRKLVDEMYDNCKARNFTQSEITYSFLELIDDLMNKTFDKYKTKVSCKRGCSHCCYQPVGISIIEAQLISDQVEFNQSEIARMTELSQYGTIKEWLALPKDKQRCIFLNDINECSIYTIRPFSCRTYYVVTDPDDCDLSKPNEKVGIVDSEQIRQLYFYFLKLFIKDQSDIGYFYKILLKTNLKISEN